MAKHISVNQANLIQRHRYILKKLAASDIKNRRKILKNAPTDLFKVLDLIFKLLDNKKLTLSKKREQEIKPHRKLIRSTSRLTPASIKTKMVRQTGGSLPKILSTVLPIIGAIVKAII